MNVTSGPRGRVAIMGIAVILAGSAAISQEADRTADVQRLGDCKGCVFDGQDFSDRKLMAIDFGQASLTGIAFDGAGLGISVFDDADLTGVSFDGADLRGASFVDARLTDVTFADADLRGAVFEGVILNGTDLQPALLCNTQMPDDELDNSDCDPD